MELLLARGPPPPAPSCRLASVDGDNSRGRAAVPVDLKAQLFCAAPFKRASRNGQQITRQGRLVQLRGAKTGVA